MSKVFKSFCCALLVTLPTVTSFAQAAQGVGDVGSAGGPDQQLSQPEQEARRPIAIEDADNFSTIELNLTGPTERTKIFSMDPRSRKQGSDLWPITKTAYVHVCRRQDVGNREAFKKNCFALSNPNPKRTTGNYETSGKDDLRYDSYIENNIENSMSVKKDLKDIVRMAMQKNIKPSEAVLVINYIDIDAQKIQIYGEEDKMWNPQVVLTNQTDIFRFRHATVGYKISAPEIIELFDAVMNKNLVKKQGFNINFSYKANRAKTDLFNLPSSFLQSRVTTQVFPGVLKGTVRDYLAMAVTYNMTRYNPAWNSIRAMLKKEDEVRMVQPLAADADVVKLSKDELVAAILKENADELVRMYSMQKFQLKNELAESKALRQNTIELDTVQKLPAFNTVYVNGNGANSAQEKLANYNLYKAQTADAINAASIGAELASTMISQILH